MNQMSLSRPAQALLIGAFLSATACSSNPAVHAHEMRSAEHALEEARQLGSERHAREIFQQAEQRLMLAQVWIDAGRAEEALRMLEQARVLAERAAAESLAEQAVRAARAVDDSLSSLQATLEVELPDGE